MTRTYACPKCGRDVPIDKIGESVPLDSGATSPTTVRPRSSRVTRAISPTPRPCSKGGGALATSGETQQLPTPPLPPLISMSFNRMGRRVTKNDQRFVYNG